MTTPESFVGVDGCKQGWVAVELSPRGFRGARLLGHFADVVAAYPSATTIAVDIPIGLVDGEERSADTAARAYLVGQSSSVFPSPPRAALAAATYAAANAIAREVNGSGISQQTFALLPKIAEVDVFIDDARIVEVHPEVSFRLLHDGIRLPHAKKTWAGAHQRRRLLAEVAGLELPDEFGDTVDDVAIDDILDAAVAAWSARRIARGEHRCFPPAPSQRDASGRLIAIRG